MNSIANKLVDQFGREHDYLRISLTERCNLRCSYCMPEEGIQLRPKSQFMSKHEVIELAKIFVSLGVKKIRLTGGEPLVRNDAHEIITELSKLPIELAITTNGILIDKFIPSFIKNNVRTINISLDSLKRDKFNEITRRNYFDTVISNIDLLLNHDFHIKLNAVLIKGVNDDEIIDFINYTKDKNIHYRFIEFMPFDGNKWDWSKGVSYKELLDKVVHFFGNEVIKLNDKKNDTSKNYRINGHKGTFAIISSVTNPFCDNCNRLRLTADGKMKNCLFSNNETDLLTAFRQGIDVKPLIYESVWHKKEKRAGMNTFEMLSNPISHNNNRSMITIGG